MRDYSSFHPTIRDFYFQWTSFMFYKPFLKETRREKYWRGKQPSRSQSKSFHDEAIQYRLDPLTLPSLSLASFSAQSKLGAREFCLKKRVINDYEEKTAKERWTRSRHTQIKLDVCLSCSKFDNLPWERRVRFPAQTKWLTMFFSIHYANKFISCGYKALSCKLLSQQN